MGTNNKAKEEGLITLEPNNKEIKEAPLILIRYISRKYPYFINKYKTIIK